MADFHEHPLHQILDSRIAIIDGAMGTTIRTYGMKEADIRGDRFKNSTKDLLNNGDLFTLTQPKMIGDIHRRFLEAGADIIETNTFGATTITQSEFFVDDPREHDLVKGQDRVLCRRSNHPNQCVRHFHADHAARYVAV